MTTAIKIENVSKLYRLGTVGTGTISHDLNRWWHSIRGKEDPYAKVGQVNDRTKAASDEKRGTSEDTGESSPLATRNSQLATSPDYVWALKDINLEVQQGEILGIIGRNGAGKSTLLKLLSRVTAPTTGAIKTKGRIASLLEVGTGFHPELTGRENIYLNGSILGMKRHEITSRLDEIVEFSGCAKYLDTPTKRYSSGMTVRLGFAVAAHLQPEVLIVDEVLAVGDASFQEKCIGKMSDMGAEGRTVIFVSHNMAAIEQLTEKCVVISRGQCVYEGPSAIAVDTYLERRKHEIGESTDFSSLPRARWSGDHSLKITRGEMPDVHSGRLSGKDGLRLVLTVAGQTDVPSFSIGVTLHYRDGTPVGSGFSQECGPMAADEQKSFELKIETAGLAPGKYWLTLGLVRGSREVIDFVDEVLHFDLVAPELLPAGVVDWNPGWGRFKLPMACR